MTERRGPVVIDLEGDAPSPADAPPVPEEGLPPAEGQAMRTVAAFAARRGRSGLARWFWRLLGAIIVFFASVAAWSAVDTLLARNETLGLAALVLLGAFALVCLALVAKEALALARLARLDTLQREAAAALMAADLGAARTVADRVAALYSGRPELAWASETYRDRREDVFDADAALGLAETTLLAPLDEAARREVEASARQVAVVTAVVPLAFADVAAALASNLRMIRRIAEIYGGRGGTLEAWRLTRAVMTHLVATGAVAVGDDLLSSIGGGHVLSRLSRRFGEGVVNGALTARVGIAAMEVCRPLPFRVLRRPRVTAVLQRATTGLFPGASGREG